MSLLATLLKFILPENTTVKIATIPASEAKALAAQGALFVDIREPGERAAGHIAGDQSLPLSRLTPVPVEAGGQAVIFYCASGNRTRMNASRLDAVGGAAPKILAGGIMGWVQAGFPLVRD